ncbi:hypothetical protein OD91_1634 [Lutibacter sp. Hel_I_33_5]|uniref:DoxX protein n=1 Tax=Lutibacter sp. Hel_I_33_5 TaxID=1566289 RepID=UPI0011A51CEF|nr:DoxX protein [Lutibacter sp. Hel_I_33_5]TVZ56349.1 hypothetical protein OD91_1634 [Lutibacter sp. Hel_I_33_5]
MNSKVTTIAQYVLGVAMLIFGLNKFFGFMPAPDLPLKAKIFMTALDSSGYIFPLLGVFYILAGILLVTKKAIPFALLILVPVSINIVAFHLKLDPKGVLFALIIATLNGYLIYAHWDRFKSLFN